MRLAMQKDCSPHNLKRGPGGTVDIEFVVQMIQLLNCNRNPDILQTGTLDAIDALAERQLLKHEDAVFLKENYQRLRSVESGLRLMNTTARHDLPNERKQLNRLAYLLNESSGQDLADSVAATMKQVREVAERLFQVD